MITLEDEREITTKDICENCGQYTTGRLIESFGFYSETRGHYFICFTCFGPCIKWVNKSGNKVYWSPVSLT